MCAAAGASCCAPGAEKSHPSLLCMLESALYWKRTGPFCVTAFTQYRRAHYFAKWPGLCMCECAIHSARSTGVPMLINFSIFNMLALCRMSPVKLIKWIPGIFSVSSDTRELKKLYWGLICIYGVKRIRFFVDTVKSITRPHCFHFINVYCLRY